MIFTIASQQGLPTAPVLVKIIVVLQKSQVIVICFKNAGRNLERKKPLKLEIK
jgi:hypothetical protein